MTLADTDMRILDALDRTNGRARARGYGPQGRRR
jgi:hypothetical protein